jgi:hypothetical protein
MKKKYGFRFGESIPKWRDRFGKGGGKIINLIWLKHSGLLQLLISNGNILTSEYITETQFFEKKFQNDNLGII